MENISDRQQGLFDDYMVRLCVARISALEIEKTYVIPPKTSGVFLLGLTDLSRRSSKLFSL